MAPRSKPSWLFQSKVFIVLKVSVDSKLISVVHEALIILMTVS